MDIFGNDVDLNKNELKNAKIGNELNFPVATTQDAGLIFFHSGLKNFYGWDGSQWLQLNPIIA